MSVLTLANARWVSLLIPSVAPSAATLALLGSCPQEVDPVWGIEWMAVPLNATNTQRCPGEVGIVTGACVCWAWAHVGF